MNRMEAIETYHSWNAAVWLFRNKTKGEPLPYFPHGVQNATYKLAILREGLRLWPDANIGIRFDGRLIGIDADGEKGKDELRQLLESQLDSDFGVIRLALSTHIQTTPRGGVHVFYSIPPQCRKIILAAKATFRPPGTTAVEIKTKSMIMSPSASEFGYYSVVKGHEVPPMEMPSRLFDAIFTEAASWKRPALHSFQQVGERTLEESKLEAVVGSLAPIWKAADGRRHELSHAIAGYLARHGIVEQDAVNVLRSLVISTGKGTEHIANVGETYRIFASGGAVKGLPSIDKIISEFER